MKITVTRAGTTGRTDDWTATAEGLARPGIGKTWGDALLSVFRANLPAFGVDELTIVDPSDEANPSTTWKAS